jgi:hypothetical protein
MGNKTTDLGQRIQALALLEAKVPVKQISTLSGLSRSQIFNIRQKAVARGYDPNTSPHLKIEYVTDAPRSGRPRTRPRPGDQLALPPLEETPVEVPIEVAGPAPEAAIAT